MNETDCVIESLSRSYELRIIWFYIFSSSLIWTFKKGRNYKYLLPELIARGTAPNYKDSSFKFNKGLLLDILRF